MITVTRAEGDQATVHGEQHDTRHGTRWGHRHDARPIVFERVQDGDNVTICAYEPGEGSCGARGIHGHHDDGAWDETRVADFTVHVPAGVKLDLGSADGDVSVRGAGSDVSAATGDGDITIDETAGPVHASTGDGKIYVSAAQGPVDAKSGDGSIEVRMSALPNPQDMHFSTGDGHVTIYLPATFAGELDASTGDGHLESDFPLEVRGRLDAPHVHATIGGGGPTHINVSTGDGDVRLRKE
jgi:DUF4097 and DUF4098 domain-containing protein YvlB